MVEAPIGIVGDREDLGDPAGGGREAHGRLVAEQLPAVLWTLDADLRVTSSIGAGLGTLGLRPHQLVGLTLFEVFRTDDPEHPSIANHRRALAGELLRFEEVRSGRNFRIQIEPLRGPDGGIQGVVGLAVDVSDQKQAEERQRRSDERLRLALAAVGMGTWDYDLRTGEVACSETTAALLGLPPGTTRYPYAVTLARVAREDRARLEEADRRSTEEGAEYAVEYRLVLPDGRTRWLVERGQVAERDADGRAVVMRGVITDATERKEAEEDLRASEVRFRAIFDAAPVGVALTDTDGRVVQANPALQAMLGYAQQELLGMTIADLTHPEDVAPNLSLLREMLAGERTGYRLEKRYLRKDGAVVWGQLTVSAIRDPGGAPRFVLGMVEDVTERKEAEASLRRSEARFRSLIANATDLITILGADGTVCYESPPIESILGYGSEELIGRNAFDLIHPDDCGAMSAAFVAVVAEPASVPTVEFRFRHADGSWRWLESTATNLLADDAVRGVVVNSRDVTDRREAEARLREGERRSRALLDAIPDLMFRLRRDGTYLDVKADREGDLPAPVEVLLGKTVAEALPAAVAGRVMAAIARTLATGGVEAVEYELELGGERRTFEARTVAAAVDEVVTIVRNVTEPRRAEEAVRRHEAHLAEAQRLAHLGSWEVDPTTGKAEWSAESYRIFGFIPGEFEVTQERFLDLVHPDDRRSLIEVAAAAERGEEGQAEYRIVRPDGTERVVWSRSEAVLDDAGRTVRLRGVNIDVTERKALEARLAHLAFHDPLTGLPSRTRFLDLLGAAIAEGAGVRGAAAAVLFLDLDGFKVVNDSLGHLAGDALLVAVAQRLATPLPPGAVLARFGGDEFAVLLGAGTDLDEATAVAQRLIDALRSPFVVEDRERFVSASIGVVHRPPRRANPHDLLRDADTALYEAKRAGRGRYAVFVPQMRLGVQMRLGRETALRRAIERDEMVLDYQPVVDLSSGQMVGAEALLRWQHPEEGLLEPAGFVHLAEETGLIVPIGRWVLREACRRARSWQEKQSAQPPLFVGVNVSPVQLLEGAFTEEVAAILGEAGLTPERLELEITESALTPDGPDIRRSLQALRKLGVRLAIDDFGAGYSSLGRLRTFAVDTLKLDRSFVASLGDDAKASTIVGAIRMLADGLEHTVTAEGVETAQQAASLRALRCDRAQGFHFARPMDGDAITKLLVGGARLPAD